MKFNSTERLGTIVIRQQRDGILHNVAEHYTAENVLTFFTNQSKPEVLFTGLCIFCVYFICHLDDYESYQKLHYIITIIIIFTIIIVTFVIIFIFIINLPSRHHNHNINHYYLHHIITIITTLSPHYHHIITPLLPLSSHHHRYHHFITIVITLLPLSPHYYHYYHIITVITTIIIIITTSSFFVSQAQSMFKMVPVTSIKFDITLLYYLL